MAHADFSADVDFSSNSLLLLELFKTLFSRILFIIFKYLIYISYYNIIYIYIYS